uniref:hypothetical protein n=1 Tax=Aquabacterium sp. TaxID=1872578 RepID=UPI0025BC8F08
MPSTDLLSQDDLQRWRACPRAHWLHQHPQARAHATHCQALPDEADALLLDQGPGAEQALRASYPEARLIPTPHTDAEWDAAIARTQAELAQGWLLGPQAQEAGRALIGACLHSKEGVRVRIDVVAAGRLGLRLFKLKYATVGDEADVDTVALWTHVVLRGGWRVQGTGLLLIDAD